MTTVFCSEMNMLRLYDLLFQLFFSCIDTCGDPTPVLLLAHLLLIDADDDLHRLLRSLEATSCQSGSRPVSPCCLDNLHAS